MEEKEEAYKSPLFHLDSIQADMYKLFSLFYSGIGIIQRDSYEAAKGEDPEKILHLKNTLKEIIGQFNQVKERVRSRIEEIENTPVKTPEIEDLLKETRELDVVLKAKVEDMEKDLPLLQDYFSDMLKKSI
ncbi:hypothetical protein NEFER03_0534 [Nematocida sp. LUAm3]|nr:hypothetical protein NEFER03_0534 [Nematocida sp. LUAm3]KAI5175501.1 hypothetical protein NEFER02_1407 [Nematocida sp. LUAm2]KAI5178469.1 hypothetical protein NEFER01_1616 [Nematocida sp. LUAm1]